jgi:hypothetical protein
VKYMSKEICSGSSPWKCSAEVAKISLEVVRNGVDIAGLSEQTVRKVYELILSGEWSITHPYVQQAILNGLDLTRKDDNHVGSEI